MKCPKFGAVAAAADDRAAPILENVAEWTDVHRHPEADECDRDTSTVWIVMLDD